MPTIVHTSILGVLWCKCWWNVHDVLKLNWHPFFCLFKTLLFNVMQLTSYIFLPDKFYFIPKRCSLNFCLQCMYFYNNAFSTSKYFSALISISEKSIYFTCPGLAKSIACIHRQPTKHTNTAWLTIQWRTNKYSLFTHNDTYLYLLQWSWTASRQG